MIWTKPWAVPQRAVNTLQTALAMEMIQTRLARSAR
jgi:hypothetical protein